MRRAGEPGQVRPPRRAARPRRRYPTAAWPAFVTVPALALVAATPAVADPAEAGRAGRVALIQPAIDDPTLAEALQRIRGELSAEGFDVTLVSTAPAPGDVLATIDLTLDAGTQIAELRVVDRATDKVVLRRAPVSEGHGVRAAEVLATRAVELLRASLLELLVAKPKNVTEADAGPHGSAAQLQAAAKWAGSSLAPAAELEPLWSMQAGLAVEASFAGVPPAAVGVLRVQRRVAGALSVRATGEGLGAPARFDTSAGGVAVVQDFALVEGVVELARHAPVHPVISIGAGPLFTSVDGRASFPYAGQHASQWSVAADAGAGGDVRIDRRWHVSLEAHALFAWPAPVFDVLGAEVARSARPSVLASLCVAGWL